MKEVGQLLRALGMTPTHLQVREIIREYDKNKDGVLNFGEFLNLYADQKAPPAGSKELLEVPFFLFHFFSSLSLSLKTSSRLSKCLTRRRLGPSPRPTCRRR